MTDASEDDLRKEKDKMLQEVRETVPNYCLAQLYYLVNNVFV